MKVISGTELLIDIRSRKYQPNQKFIRQTEQKDLLKLDYNYDLVWCDNNLPLKSHSISDFDFEVLEEEKKIELPEKYTEQRLNEIPGNLSLAQNINGILDYLKYKEEEKEK